MRTAPRHLLLWAALLATGLFAGTAQADAYGQPFLYRVAAQPPAYLFGTIHLPDARVVNLPDVVTESFAKTKILYTEIKLDPETQLQMAEKMTQAGAGLGRLRDRIPPELYTRLESYMAKRSLPMVLFEQQPIWMITVTLPVMDHLELLQSQPALDMYLAQRAMESGVEIRGLESIDEQLGIFTSVSEEDQVRLLADTLGQLEEAQAQERDLLQELISVYLTGDGDKLLAEMAKTVDKSDPVAVAVYEKLLDARSAIMAERIGKILKTEPGPVYFFAVGAGHLPGEKGIVALLRASGLQVERVPR